jgi:molybdenum cofactor cytidylyltransferase
MMPIAEGKLTIGIILLAAGDSSRLGQPKQLLLYNGQTLLQRSLHAASNSHAHPLIVVLGANANNIKKEIDNDAHVVTNDAWKEGMASSIRCGIQTLLKISLDADGAILMVCDQPYISSAIINTLIATHQQTGKPIITCSYADTFGPPTLFHRSIFPELLQLSGDVGAKSILKQHAGNLEFVLFPEGNIDIDTQADYRKLL